MEYIIENGMLISARPDENDREAFVPDGVTEIGSAAFKLCRDIELIVIPEGVTEIGTAAFARRAALREVRLPQSLVKLNSSAFFACRKLQKVNLPEGLTEISANTFMNCGSLTDVNIPESVTVIERYAFNHCKSLKSVRLPEGLECIGKNAFNSCGIERLEIPPRVTVIESGAFCMCDSLTSVKLHEGITSIEDNAFFGCSRLKTVDGIRKDGGINISGTAFELTLWCALWPDDFLVIGDLLYKYCGSDSDVVIPSHVKRIGEQAFLRSGVVRVKIPASVEVINGEAFSSCTGLEYAEIAARTVSRAAFYECSKLRHVVFEETVKETDYNAFFLCDIDRYEYRHTYESGFPQIMCPISDRLNYICMPNLRIDEVGDRHAMYCAAAGFAELCGKGHSFPQDIAAGFLWYLKNYAASFRLYICGNEYIAACFCRYHLLNREMIEWILSQRQCPASVTAMLLQYKHEYLGADDGEYQI